MFTQWLLQGLHIGVTAFFAAFAFLAGFMALLALASLFGSIIKAVNGDDV